MSGAYALGRLVWRPAALLMLFPIVLGLLLVLLPEPAPAADAFRIMGVSQPELIRSLWRAHGVIALIGAIVAMIGREPQSSMRGWVLPNLHQQLFRATSVVAVICALPIAAIFARSAGTSMGFAVFGSSLLAFAVGTEIADSVRNGRYRIALLSLLVMILWKPEYAHRAVQVTPLGIALLTMSGAVFLFWRSYDRVTLRERPFVVDLTYTVGGVEALRAYWAKRKLPETEWTRPLHGSGVRTWVSAAMYESFTGRNGGWMRFALTQMSIGIALGYLMNGPWFVVFSAIQIFTLSGLQLRMHALYPLSRRELANLNFACSLFENAFVAIVSGAAVWALYSFGPGHLLNFSRRAEIRPIMAATYTAFGFALAPIAQWAKTRGPMLTAAGANPMKMSLSYLWIFAFMIPYITVTIPLLEIGASLRFAWTIAAMLAVFVQAIYWIALRWFYGRANLVVPSRA